MDGRVVWHVQHRATAQHVDVAVAEGIGVLTQDRQHHLLNRDRIVGPIGAGQRPQRVAGSDRTDFTASRARGGRSGCGSRHGGRQRRRHGRTTAYRRGRATDRRRGGLTAIGIVERRVEQHGVFAQQAAIAPVHFQQKIQEGLADWLARRDRNVVLAVGRVGDREAQFEQGRDAVYARTTELILAGQGDRQGVEILGFGA